MILNYKDINIYQGDHLVLHDVNMQVSEGEMVYLVGAVGSGKTSLLKTMYGEVPCEGESADIMGYNLVHIKTSQLPSLRRQLGIVFQDFQLLPDRTVHSNLDFVLRSTDWRRRRERDKRIEEVLNMVRLEDKLEKRIYELSGGEQQRICIARAILNNPKIILADEPTGNLDAENGEMIMALLDEIRRQHHAAVIVSTHNMQWLDYFPGTVYKCQHAALIKDGETPSEEK